MREYWNSRNFSPYRRNNIASTVGASAAARRSLNRLHRAVHAFGEHARHGEYEVEELLLFEAEWQTLSKYIDLLERYEHEAWGD